MGGRPQPVLLLWSRVEVVALAGYRTTNRQSFSPLSEHEVTSCFKLLSMVMSGLMTVSSNTSSGVV